MPVLCLGIFGGIFHTLKLVEKVGARPSDDKLVCFFLEMSFGLQVAFGASSI